jgi:hypothetical protein
MLNWHTMNSTCELNMLAIVAARVYISTCGNMLNRFTCDQYVELTCGHMIHGGPKQHVTACGFLDHMWLTC